MTLLSQWLLLLIIGLLPIVRPFSFRAGGFLIPLTDLIFPLLFIAFLCALTTGKLRLSIGRVHYFIGFYGIALVLSAVFSAAPATSFLKVMGEVYLFGLALITFTLLSDRQFLKRIVIAWLVGTGVAVAGSLIGVFLFYLGFKSGADNYFLSHFGSLPKGNYPRVHSVFANANMMCNYLNISLVMALLAKRTGWIRRSSSVALQAGIWFAAFFTFSAGIGGLILTYGLWFAGTRDGGFSNIKGRVALVVCSFIAFAAIFVSMVSPDTANTDADVRIPVVNIVVEPSVRLLIWQDTIEKVKMNPWLGVGTGLDPTRLSYKTLGGETQQLRDAHNVWLSILGQTGLIGLLALIALSYYFITCCKLRVEVIAEVSTIRLAFSCAFIGAFLYQGLTGSFEDARHLWILFGVLSATSLWDGDDISQVS